MKLSEFSNEMKEHLKHSKNVIVMHGNVNDLFPHEKNFLSLAECLINEFKSNFTVVQFDMLNGFNGNLNIFERASFDPATPEFRNNEYEKLNAQINTLTSQIPKIDRALKQSDYKIIIVIQMAHQIFNKNSVGRERIYLEMGANQPAYSASGNVVVLLTPNANDLPLETSANTATIKVNLPEEKQIEYLLMTRNAINDFKLFGSQEVKECVRSLLGLSYREIASIIKIKQNEPKCSFKETIEEFRYGSQKTNSLVENIKKQIPDMGKYLLLNIKGQNKAINTISKAIAGKYLGLGKSEKPLVIFCLGQTGVGKTQTPKEVTRWLHGNENRLVRYNMNEYMSESDSYRLLGSAPGYIGHEKGASLAIAVRNNPYAIILFDEMEKAHWRVQDVLLGIMADGFLRDNQDSIVSFKNTIIFLTTNILNQESLSSNFRPEFINRVSLIVQYAPLSKEICELILENKLQKVTEDATMDDLSLKLDFTKEAKKYLVDIGFDPRRNARELDRVIEREVNDKVTDFKINGCIQKGDAIKFDVSENEGLKISIRNNTSL